MSTALADARTWCAGRIIDDRPALAHAVRVTLTLTRHGLHDPELLAAALLHDSPEFAPPDLDLDTYLTDIYSREVARIVRALQVEHQALDAGAPTMTLDDPPVLLASTADQIVALSSLLTRAHRSGDVTGFFTARPALLQLLPHFAAGHRASTGRIPTPMTEHLGAALHRLDMVTAAARATLR
ncbi:metal-dependent phosphohydrolase [Actinoplanes sp. NPDC051494]|uniref:metal-dependent phosphohydrolase n=1 Tax=Actinoplanes sp. NPDC051494 TaxID=3363907 RepID=UPI0037B003EF